MSLNSFDSDRGQQSISRKKNQDQQIVWESAKRNVLSKRQQHFMSKNYQTKNNVPFVL